MKKKIIKAIFKGQDGSCGYRTNREYILTIWHHSESGHRNIAIELADKPDENYCEYESIVSFLNNWDKITVLKETVVEEKEEEKRFRGDNRKKYL